MKVNTIVVGLVLLVGFAAGLSIGMNIRRDAPIFSNPFVDQETHTKLSGPIERQTADMVTAAKQHAQTAIDKTKPAFARSN